MQLAMIRQQFLNFFRPLPWRFSAGTAAIAIAFQILQGSVVGAGDQSTGPVRFSTEVVPLLTRLGCNGGGCHGKATGQNGFRLSLLGFEPDLDYQSLVNESRGRRIFPGAPGQSLILLKATARIPHGGGRLLDESGDDYGILRRWIEQGAMGPQANDPVLVRIELWPMGKVMPVQTSQQLQVKAFFSDGTSRDVSRQAMYQSNEPGIATVDASGKVQTSSQHGLVAVMARFGEQIATFQGVVPFVQAGGQMNQVQAKLDEVERLTGGSPADKYLIQQWRKLGVIPSRPAEELTFLRRVMIDICGTLPKPEEVLAFAADKESDKRSKLIDRLLERPEYASYFSMKWADILQNRGSGYSTSKQRPGTTLFSGWIRDSLASNKPYDQFVAEILTASGRQNENPPAIWYRSVRKSPEYVESVAQAFLGVRIQCAQCHHHPTESWSQADYFGLAAVFAKVGRKGGFADAEVPTDQVIYLAERGEVVHPRTGAALAPRPLGGPEFEIGPQDDPRLSLARWMTSPANPYFARTMVNRMWAHFLGRGLVHPLDDSRSTNPPSNPELLESLANNFRASGYDIKHLIRMITKSYAYGLESLPSDGNLGDTQTFARFYTRRLTAETLLDGISQILEVPSDFPGMPPGTRAMDLPDENVAAPFLDIFGRPARQTACECERVDAPALHQALELVNSTEIQRKLASPEGYAKRLASGEKTNDQRVTEAFLRVLARPPRPEELKAALGFLKSEPDLSEACRSLLWSLLATNEFLFNH